MARGGGFVRGFSKGWHVTLPREKQQQHVTDLPAPNHFNLEGGELVKDQCCLFQFPCEVMCFWEGMAM